MTISSETRKMLWGRSGGVCAMCRTQVFEDSSETDDPSVLAEECHIVGEKNTANSPRGLSDLDVSKRNLFGNLILLCPEHHKIIDDQELRYPVELLHRIRSDHLAWVRGRLDFDEEKQRDEEVDLEFAAHWADLAGLDTWEGFTYSLMNGDAPGLRKERIEQLDELQDWLFKRKYPSRYPKLDRAFENFKRVLHDFRAVFSRHLEPDALTTGFVRTEKFYKIKGWEETLYRKLGAEYDEHCRLLNDYTLELTRAANLLCDTVREHVYRHFRISEGVLVARIGLDKHCVDRTVRIAYRPDEITDYPYPGMDAFLTMRTERDFAYGAISDATD